MNTSDSETSRPKQPRRYYDDPFKRDAVALLEIGRSATRLSRELGVSLWNLRDWKRFFGSGGAKAAAHPPQAPLSGGTVETTVELAELRRKLETSERQRDIFKSLGHRCPGAAARHTLMDTLCCEDPGMDVSEACEVPGISRSGYHAHRKKRRSEDAVLGSQVREAFVASRGSYDRYAVGEPRYQTVPTSCV